MTAHPSEPPADYPAERIDYDNPAVRAAIRVISGGPGGAEAPRKPRFKTITASDVTIRRISYAWEGRVPIGALTLMPGEEGIGKTLVGIRLMADFTHGRVPGEWHGTPRDVIILAPEDGIEDVFTPRLEQAGADLTRVHFVVSREQGEEEDSVILPRDLDLLAEAVREFNAPFVWVDSFITVLPDELKSISYKDVNKALKSISGWCDTNRVAFVAPWHLNKQAGSDTAVRMMDSRGFRTAVRSLLLVVEDPDAPEGLSQGIVALDKVNAGPRGIPAWRYRIRSADYTVMEPDRFTGKLREVNASCGVADWVGEVDGDGREIARAALVPRIDKDDPERDWLLDFLTERGPIDRGTVMEAAVLEGYKERKIKDAARKLRVHSESRGGQRPDGSPYKYSVWSLSQSDEQPDHTRMNGPTGPTGETQSGLYGPISAGHAQSAQSVQSDGVYGNGRPTGRPTGCLVCGHPIDPAAGTVHPECETEA
jgi:archaellum biogenesis ATPase FlaH